MHIESIKELKAKTKEMKLSALKMCEKSEEGYPSSGFSCAEIMTVLYYHVMKIDPDNPKWADRDRFIMSKGHGSTILYPILKDLGFINQEVYDSYLKLGGDIGLMLKPTVPGVDCVGGSLGMGMGVACGHALSAKLNRQSYLTFCIIGDGECSEGSIWEAAMFAGKYKLNNLITFLDRNYVCKTDLVDNLIKLEPVEDKWRSFGWDVVHIDGHDIGMILDTLKYVRMMRNQNPLMIIADTVKGKGVDFMENAPLWHGAMPKKEKFTDAYSQIEQE